MGPVSALSVNIVTRSVGVHSTFTWLSVCNASASSVERIRVMSALPVRTSAMRVDSCGTGCISTAGKGGLPRQ
ncbi:MAG: hypothetical protein ABS99_10255 [Acetobacteraceae bacterium SCN 69-10]|nr:MAG: hypothetical protein ABS99_10255 [Acetobacteraceae bacterium SCN 69-10]